MKKWSRAKITISGAHAERFYRAALALCSVAGLAGLPVVTLPLATFDGCPLGLSVIAGSGEDEALLAFARSQGA